MLLKVKKIYIDLHNDTRYIFSNLIDNLPIFNDESEIESTLKTFHHQFKEYGWKYFDSSFSDEFDSIPLKKEINKKISMESMKYIFIKATFDIKNKNKKDQNE